MGPNADRKLLGGVSKIAAVDAACGVYRVADGAGRGHGASATQATVHNCGVQLVVAACIEHRPVTSIEIGMS